MWLPTSSGDNFSQASDSPPARSTTAPALRAMCSIGVFSVNA